MDYRSGELFGIERLQNRCTFTAAHPCQHQGRHGAHIFTVHIHTSEGTKRRHEKAGKKNGQAQAQAGRYMAWISGRGGQSLHSVRFVRRVCPC